MEDATVTMISVEMRGEFLASCAEDKVFVHGLLTTDYNLRLKFDRMVHSVAIDPNFGARGSDRKIVTGDDRELILHYRNFFSKYTRSTLHSGDGKIKRIKWRGSFISWATEHNVRIYDVSQRAIITVIKRDHDTKLRRDLYSCCMFWKNDTTLLMGWGDSVKVCEVKQRPQVIPYDPDLPDKYVEISCMFSIEYSVCGIASIQESNLVLLVMDKDNFQTSGSTTPQLMIVKPIASFDYQELSSDILSPKGYQHYQPHDYHLEALTEDGYYMLYIVSPKDVILAKPREDDDHIQWLLERQKYDEALKAIKESKNCRRYNYVDVGRDYLNTLLISESEEDVEKAARLSPSICGLKKNLWTEVFKSFEAINKLRTLAPHLPTGPGLVLDQEIYESVLHEFIKMDSKGFLETIEKWPTKLYRSSSIIHMTMDILQFNAKDENLLRGLAEVYTNESRHDKSLEIYLQIGDSLKVFQLISRFDLYSTLKEKLSFLMQLNPEEASKLLIENRDKIPIDHVVNQLKNKPQLIWVYLDQVIKKDANLCLDHHELMVDLYATQAPHLLLPFLKISNNYSLEKAYKRCQSKNLVSEMVFLLARMGNSKEALHYITDSLNDINKAIDFCKDQDDFELWSDLIQLSMKKPDFIRKLISNIGTYIPDPILLIDSIPQDLEIPGLKEALEEILDDYKIQIELNERAKKVLNSDSFDLLDKFIKNSKRASSIDERTSCSACFKPILSKSMLLIFMLTFH